MSEILNFHEVDFQFADELAAEPGCGHLRHCFACGVCTAACPVSEIEPGFSPAIILRQILHGQRDQLLASPLLWQCARCARCSFQCPQDVRFLDIIQGLQRMAVRLGVVSAVRADQIEKGERLIRELRSKFIQQLWSSPEETDAALVLDHLRFKPE